MLFLKIKNVKLNFRGAPSPSDSPSGSESELALPVSYDSIDEDYENDSGVPVLHWSFF
jgi:hypothetical protein